MAGNLCTFSLAFSFFITETNRVGFYVNRYFKKDHETKVTFIEKTIFDFFGTPRRNVYHRLHH